MKNLLIKADNNIQVVTDLTLWNLLFEDLVFTNSRKLTKGEAFYDLLMRQKFAIIDGQDALPGNYQVLSGRWGWHRMTVKRFLADLKAVGAISIEQTANRTVIRVIGMSVTTGDALAHCLSLSGDDHSESLVPP